MLPLGPTPPAQSLWRAARRLRKDDALRLELTRRRLWCGRRLRACRRRRRCRGRGLRRRLKIQWRHRSWRRGGGRLRRSAPTPSRHWRAAGCERNPSTARASLYGATTRRRISRRGGWSARHGHSLARNLSGRAGRHRTGHHPLEQRSSNKELPRTQSLCRQRLRVMPPGPKPCNRKAIVHVGDIASERGRIGGQSGQRPWHLGQPSDKILLGELQPCVHGEWRSGDGHALVLLPQAHRDLIHAGEAISRRHKIFAILTVLYVDEGMRRAGRAAHMHLLATLDARISEAVDAMHAKGSVCRS